MVASTYTESFSTRRAERFLWRSQCEFLISGRRQVGVIINISKTGLFVQTATTLAHRGSAVALTIPDSKAHPAIVIQACVARRQSASAGFAGGGASGLGLQIVASSPQFEEVLQHCEALRHGDSDLCQTHDASSAHPAAQSLAIDPGASFSSTLFRVRVMLQGTTRSRMLTVQGASADEARAKALAQVHPDWKIIEVSPRCV